MPKKFYLVTKISKEKYLELVSEAGYKNERNYLRASSSGSAPIKPEKNRKRWVGYSSDNGLEVLVDSDYLE